MVVPTVTESYDLGLRRLCRCIALRSALLRGCIGRLRFISSFAAANASAIWFVSCSDPGFSSSPISVFRFQIVERRLKRD